MNSDAPKSRLDADELAKRRVPCMAAFIHPFRIVNDGASPAWDPSVDDINRGQWDYAELHRIVGGLDVGLPTPFHMVVARDGGVGLPALAQLRNEQAAVEFFNRSFAALLLGGVYCEAIGVDGLDFGFVLDWRYLRVHTFSLGTANRFHQLIRYKRASPFEAINLVNPRTVSVAALSSAMQKGRAVLDKVPELSGEFILKGVTGFARRDWGVALANLWIVVEQVTSSIWSRKVLHPARSSKAISGRMDQLADARTWTVAARHELLHQIGVLSLDTFAKLSLARRARNALAHNGQHPTEANATAAYEGAISVLCTAAEGLPIPLRALNLKHHSLSDPFQPRAPHRLQPTHWMEIPKLPGEAELERREGALKRNAGSRLP